MATGQGVDTDMSRVKQSPRVAKGMSITGPVPTLGVASIPGTITCR